MHKATRSTGETGQELANRCCETMWSGDRVAQALGMNLLSVGPGHAEISLEVGEDMVSSFDLVHGGVVFTLADTAFSLACNSRNRTSFAMSCSIDFVRPAVIGETLIARAIERSHSRSSGFFEVTVTNQDGGTVAHFRGRSFTRGEPLIEEQEP